MKYIFTLSIITLLSINCFGQSVYTNYDIDTTVYDVAEPLNLWLTFLETKDDSLGSIYWNEQEVNEFGYDSYFLIEKQLNFGLDNYLKLLSYTTVKVLSVRKIENYYKITSLMEFPTKENKGNIQYIFSVYAGDENGTLKLFNPLKINQNLYLSNHTVGYIRFHHPKSHPFNADLAKKQNDFLICFSKDFGVPIDTIDYYFASTNEEVQRMRGFDFIIGDNGIQIPSGKSDVENRIVYSNGLAEYYPHEFIHILLNKHFKNYHLWAMEGVATYWGMSRGKELDWHLKRLHLYLQDHSEINLNNMLELRTMDYYTDYRYVLGGFIIKKIFKKGKYKLVKELLESGKTDTEFYAAIESFLGIKQEDLNNYIRHELKKMFKKG